MNRKYTLQFTNFHYLSLFDVEQHISLFTPPVNIYKNTVDGFRNKRSGLPITATSTVSLGELQTNIQYEVYTRIKQYGTPKQYPVVHLK